LVEHFAGTWTDNQLTDHGLDVEVDVIERLPTPWGLVRAGVAPDHPEKKRVTDAFDAIVARHGIRFLGNVEVGRDVMPGELSEWYDAVILAVGANGGRALPVPGAEMAGCWTAHDVVGWYNGHPDCADRAPDLSTGRAVIVGNGNVAMDIARLLVRDVSVLAETDIARGALGALRASAVREVVVLGRRGPENAAFGTAELDELEQLADSDGVDLVVDSADLAGLPDHHDDPRVRRRLVSLRRIAARPLRGHDRRIVLRFHTSPVEVTGEDCEARSLRIVNTRTGVEPTAIETGLVIASIGFASGPIAGWPFDESRRVVPTVDGRVVGPDGAIPGLYATGWVKRGPTGMIGTNKACARDTVGSLLSDAANGRLATRGTLGAEEVLDVLQRRSSEIVSWAGWRRIDVAERSAGQLEARPRVKLTDADRLVATALGNG
jgi:ferredoxin--NADP+ reductase